MADRPIPDDLRVICAEMAGHELLGGNLRIYPLESDDPDAVLAWACPGLPDPYERGLTAEQVNEFARSDGRQT